MTKLLNEVMDAMKQFDPNMAPNSDGYAEAVIMLAALTVGADEAKLAAGLGYDPEFVALVGNRLRNARIWADAGTDEAFFNRWTGPDGGLAFLCDVNVASGRMIVAHLGEDGEPQYSITESGKRHVEQMLADARIDKEAGK